MEELNMPVLPVEPVLPEQPDEADIKLFAVVESNVIVNVARAVEPLAANWLPLPEGAGIGWRRASKSKPFLPPAAAPEPVPAQCTRRQGQLALLSLGLLDDAEAAIAALDDPTERRAAQIEYDADTWERSNAFLSGLWAQLGGTPESLDDAFRLAVTL